MRSFVLGVVGIGWAALSCGGTTGDGQDAPKDGSAGASASSGAGGGGADGAAAGPVICAGVECAAGEDCCLLDGSCFDPAQNPNACAAPSGPPRRGQAPCNASSQCAPGEYCAPDELCLGPGFCTSLTNCGSSSGMPMCGCNGVTYPNVETACHEGVKIIGPGECGKTQVIGAGGSSSGKIVTFCATDAMCPSGQACCHITGQCHDAAIPELCAFPPEGTDFPCIDDSQCYEGHQYCRADACGAPGGCDSIPSSCSGELVPVCGCNGQSYVNASCAAAAGVNVAHEGECP